MEKVRAWAGWEYVGLALVTALSGVLRFWQLGRQDLWLDELFSVSITSDGLSHAISEVASDTSPPLYWAVQSLLTPWLGRTEFALRIFPAVTGILATIVVFFLGKALYDRRVGLWGALLFAVSPFAIRYSQEARPYALLMLFVALAMLAFVQLAKNPGWLNTAFFGLSLTGLLYSHVYGYMAALFFLIPVFAVSRLRARVRSAALASYALAAMLFLPWALVLVDQVRSVLESSAGGTWWGDPVEEVVSAFIDRFMKLSPSEDAWTSVLFALLFMLGMPFHTRETVCDAEKIEARAGVEEDDLSLAMLAVSVLPIFVGVVLSKYVTPVATSRNSVIALPAAALFAARGGLRLPKWVGTGLLAALVALSLVALPPLYADDDKGYWRDATEFVLKDAGSAGVIAETYEGGLCYRTYADLLGEKDAPVAWMSGDEDADDPDIAPWDADEPVALSAYLATHDTVIVLMPWGEPGAAEDYLDSQADWKAVQTLDLHNPVVKVWQRTK